MIIGGNSGFYVDSSPVEFASTTGISFVPATGYSAASAASYGGGGFYTGVQAQAPFNPYGPATFGAANPFVAPNTQANQVVYAHYGPGSAMAGADTTAAAKPAEEPKPAEAPKPAEEPKPEPPKTVKVASGDNLTKIAKANGTTWQKLYELNKEAIGDNPNLIHAGLELKLP